MKDLKNRVTIITGASRGIGKALAMGFAREGARLALAARSTTDLAKVADDARALGAEVISVPTDVTLAADRANLLARTEAELGPPDILVNNAGLEQLVYYADETVEHIRFTLAVNLEAALLLTRAVLPGMLARGRGHIVSMASIAGKKGAAYNVSYSATKAGLIAFTSALRAEIRGTGVSASAIMPGYVYDDGMYARFKLPSTLLLGGTTLDRVTRATLGAIRHDRPEVIVNSGPVWLQLLVGVISPRFGNFVVETAGITRHQRRLAELDRQMGGSSVLSDHFTETEP